MSSASPLPETTPASRSPATDVRADRWRQRYAQLHRPRRVTDFPVGIVPPKQVRIYRRSHHYLLQWWDPREKGILSERVDGDFVAAIARDRQIDERLEHFRTSGHRRPVRHQELVDAYTADLRRRADAGEIDPRTVNRYASALTNHYLAYALQPSVERQFRQVATVNRDFRLDFAGFLANTSVRPNGHPNTAPRPMRGQNYVMNVVRAMFRWATDPDEPPSSTTHTSMRFSGSSKQRSNGSSSRWSTPSCGGRRSFGRYRQPINSRTRTLACRKESSMKGKIERNAEDSTSIKTLVHEIVKEQEKISRYEGDIVVSHIHIGRHPAGLRTLAKRTWGKQLKAIGISPRVAGRYLKISGYWQDEIGLTESDLLPRLPQDLLKLEWLCRVPLPQLGDLLGELDCKKASRPQVIAAVREALGEDPPAGDEQGVEEFVGRFIGRFVRTVDRLSEKFPEPEQHEHARKLLAAGLQRVRNALKASRRAASGS